MPGSKKGFSVVEVVVILLVLGVIGAAGGLYFNGRGDDDQNSNRENATPTPTTATESDAVHAGRQLANNNCSGEGVTSLLSHAPMDPNDFSIVIPYGLMIGGHVTPIDHQYFSPVDYQSQPDAYPVYAMGDATIVDIGTRPRPFGEEYRIVFSVSCTYLYYYDLVTSLTDDVKTAYDEWIQNKDQGARLSFLVKAGQQIGNIGGQTLDFAVWDTTKPLTGFVVPEHYSAESWKIYTADPLDYYTDELKERILSRYVRKVEPISGKIDYDVDGRLIGTWFLQGTNGYAGAEGYTGGDYWGGHLSFAPNLYVPDWFEISIGDFNGEAKQFVTTANSPQPSEVTTATGLVKYELADLVYMSNGQAWDQNSLVDDLSVQAGSYRPGCALVQMTGDREIKFETFANVACSSVLSFTEAAKVYTR
ncbi:hypothetical protein KC614_03300 [candidate division WWE3 bacterium]|uniref:Uncharacterized protein n=1 Tax=candidate division WWE3 bacterium TaxID=2053526 RepID=A0A955RR03_UNCKA|nr:hypothetical protein [candidate division WWE3 bacterium]